MAQDAELKLKVSLDLAFFKQELNKIGAQLSGQPLQLNIQFNKKSIADQYQLLGQYLERKTFKIKVESPTLDVLVQKVSTFKKNLIALGNEKIDLAVNVVSNIDEVRKSIKDRLPSVGIATKLNEPTNVDDFIREVGKKVKGQVEKSYAGGGIPIATKLETPGTTSLIKSLQENLNNQDPLRAKVSTTPSIIGDDVKAFRDAVKEKFSGIVVKIKAELEGAGQGASEQGGRNFSQAALRKLGQDIKPLYRAAADAGLVEFNESIANNVQSIAKELSNVSGDLIEGLLNGLKSKDPQIKAAAKNLGEALISSIKSILGIASPSKVFKAIGEDVGKGFELGATASMDRAFDELERKLQGRLNKLQAMLRMAPSRRSDFPFVAMGGPPESAPIAREIDQAYAQLAQIKERRQERLASERGSLAQAAGRMLPAGASAIPAVSGQDIVIKNFYKSMQDAQRMLQENFSANSYLPRATRNFAASMQQASQGIKAITGARGPIAALPSSEMLRPMMEQRQFQAAIMQAIKTDMQNALRQQMQGRMLPAAGQSSYRSPQQKEQQRFQEAINKAAAIDAEKAAIFAARQARTQAGEMLRQTRAQMRVPALPAAGQSSFGLMKNRELQSSLANIGTFGRQETGGVQGIIASGKGSIFEKLKASAIAFAQNAPTVIKYLNLFRPERISVSDLPSEKEGPGQFVQRISQQLKEGLFGPGTRPAQSRQFFEFGQGAQLPGMPLQRALPPIGGSGGGDRVTGMGQPPQRGGAIVPFAPATRLPEGYFENAKKYSAALEMARATSAKFTASQLPLVGGLREVASEFGFAIKQVLLFGTAYKALAFVQSLPGQILNAAKSQQQYNNALQTATQDTGTFAKELLYVDNVQRAFGLNLETTRTGFTRLYASMAPTGFDSGSIEKLFTGISAATAALQLTPDKAERVIYAFGQMASKGQIMSEELKGQLGDVLPGALAIFAKAAGMSVKEFSKAMEDGEFVGSKFRDTFAKVADELMTRFGTGAQAAGKSLQGLLNTVQGDFQRTLESFAPLANAAAQAILGPLGGSLKQLSMSAQIATGEIERTFMQLKQAQKDLGSLRTGGADAGDIRAAEQNVAALTARYKALQQAAQDPAIAKQAQDVQLFTQELAKAGTFVMNMARAIGGMLSPVLNILGTNLTTVISLVTSFYIGFQTARLAAMALMGILLTYRALSTILGFGPATLGANALAGAFNTLGVAATGATVKAVGLTRALQVFAATTIVGAIAGGIMLIAGAFGTMRDRAKEAAQSSKDAAKAAVDAAASGNVAGAQMSMQSILAQSRADKKALETLRNLRSRSTALQREGGFSVSLIPEESAALQGSALTKGMLGGIKNGRRQMRLPTAQQMQQLQQDFGRVAQEQKVSLQEAKSAVATAQVTARDIGLNVPTPSATKPETEAPDEKALKKAQQDAEQLAKQEQQRRIEQANFDNDMEKLGFDYKMQLSDEAFEHQRRLIDERNQYELSGLNDMQAHQVKFAQDLKKIRLDAEDAIRKAIQKTQEAQLNVTAAQRTAQAAGVSPMGGQAIFGNTGRTSQAAGWVHGHFQTNTASLATLIGDVVPVVKKLLSQGIPVELSGGQKFNTGMSDADIAALLRKGASQHGHSGDGRSIDLFVPKGTAVPTPLSDVRNTGGRGGITGVLPGSGQSWVGHLDPRSKSGAKQSSASFSMATKMQKENFDLQKQYAQSANQISLQTLEIERAIQLAKEQTATVIKTNINSLFPVEQQKLDIRLQQMRHNLLMQGMPQEYIDYEEKRTIATEKAAGMTKTMIAENVEARKTLEDYNQKIAKGIELLPSQKAEMGVLNNQIKLNEQGLKDLAKAQEESNIKSLESAIATMKQADALKAMEEVSNRINDAVTGVTDTYKSMFKEIAMGGDSVEALKKAQQALADQFLTMVFDMAMKPVEESMKNTLGKMFGVPDEKKQREDTIASMEAQLRELEAHKVHLKNIDANTSITAGKTPASGTIPAPAAPAAPGQATAAGIPGVSLAGTAALQTLPFNGQTGGILQTLPFNGQTGGMYQNLPFPTQDTGFLSSIGINSEDMKASMSESVTAFSEQLGKFDASIADSAFAVDEAGTAMSKGGPAGKKWQESLGQVVGGLGMAAGAVMGIVAGINQVKEGGTSNVLGGIGMIASMAGSLLGGFSGLFGGGSAGQFGTSSAFNGTADALGAAPFAPKIGGVFANGGVVRGGFRAFANGGVVGGPTLGLMGEGKYNEAIVPLPDGKSIPVQLGGGSSRDLLSKGSSKQQNASPVLSMSFQTTKFGDKEYVDIGQLQAAMAETRRLAAREGAAQGSQLALNRLRNSPNTRRQLGLG